MYNFNPLFKVIACINQKGGVGKTSVAAILSEYLAFRDLRVLLVDLDMQCNSSDHWIGMEAARNKVGGQLPPVHPEYTEEDEHWLCARSTIADIFDGKGVLPWPTYIQPEEDDDENIINPGMVDIMLGHPEKLEKINTTFAHSESEMDDKVINQLLRFLQKEEVQDSYDVVILDTGPSRSPIFRAAVRAATHIVVPFEPEVKSLQGINAMLQVREQENYHQLRSEGNKLQLVGLLPNKVRMSTSLHRKELAKMYKEMPAIMMPKDIYLPLSTDFPKRDVKEASPKSVFALPNSNKARFHADKVCETIFNKVWSSNEQQQLASINEVEYA